MQSQYFNKYDIHIEMESLISCYFVSINLANLFRWIEYLNFCPSIIFNLKLEPINTN